MAGLDWLVRTTLHPKAVAVGRLHKPWYLQESPDLFLETLRAAKGRVDHKRGHAPWGAVRHLGNYASNSSQIGRRVLVNKCGWFYNDL